MMSSFIPLSFLVQTNCLKDYAIADPILSSTEIPLGFWKALQLNKYYLYCLPSTSPSHPSPDISAEVSFVCPCLCALIFNLTGGIMTQYHTFPE